MVAQGTAKNRILAMQSVVQKFFFWQEDETVGVIGCGAKRQVPIWHIPEVLKRAKRLPQCARKKEIGGGNGKVSPHQCLHRWVLALPMQITPLRHHTLVHAIPPMIGTGGHSVFVNKAHPGGDENFAVM